MPFAVKSVYNGTNHIKGKQIDIACKCWFTSSGVVTPLLIKVKVDDELKKIFETDSDEIITISDIAVHSREESNFCGLSNIVYRCGLKYKGENINVKIIYHKGVSDKWTMILE